MRTFAYCRVSTIEQDTATQIHHIRNAGYVVESNRVIEERISGSVAAAARPGFQKLLDRMEPGDTLVVLKMDRLGRDAVDVQKTVTALLQAGIIVVSLDLPSANLASAEGKLMMQVMMAFSEFERNRIKERTTEALAQKKAAGVKLGRPEATDTTRKVQECKTMGLSQSQTAEHLKVSLRTVKNHWNIGQLTA